VTTNARSKIDRVFQQAPRCWVIGIRCCGMGSNDQQIATEQLASEVMQLLASFAVD
jgi:hypothetical protein